MWKAVRHRRGQALVVLALSTLITTCAVVTPLYDRVLQQAFTGVSLDSAGRAQTDLQISSQSRFSRGVPLGQASSPTAFADLRAAVPVSILRHYDRGTPQVQVDVADPEDHAGHLLYRAGACAEVRLVSGSCPSAPDEVAVSSADLAIFGFGVGTTIPSRELTQTDAGLPITAVPLRVVGVYRVETPPAWPGDPLVGRSGIAAQPGPGAKPQHDTWLTSGGTFAQGHAADWIDPVNTFDFTLDRSDAGVDQVLALAPQIKRFAARQDDPSDLPTGVAPVEVDTRIASVADVVREGRGQSRITLPLLMAQLGLLALVVLWLVLGAATEQRRPEVAVARLRGRGAAGARRLLLAELIPIVLLGVPLGAVVGVALVNAARLLLLPGSAPFELGWGFVLAVALAAVVLAGLTFAAAWQTTRESVASLLRRVPARRSGWALGAADAVVITASGTAAVAFLVGSLTGPVALVGPSLLALAVGLLMAHALVPVASAAGARLLARGRVVAAVSVLGSARRPATRRTVAILTVATALLVFATDAFAAGTRTRDDSAQQQVGAPMTAEVESTDVVAVRHALARVHDRDVTPVVLARPAGAEGRGTLAVVPDEFRRIALFPRQDIDRLPWNRLPAPTRNPIRLTGSAISLTATADSLTTPAPIYLQLVLLRSGGDLVTVTLGRLPADGPAKLTSVLACQEGCTVLGISLATAATVSVAGSLTLTDVLVAGGSTDFPGSPDQWRFTPTSTTPVFRAYQTEAGVFGMRLELDSGTVHELFSAAVPASLPALVAGGGAVHFQGKGLADTTRSMTRIARVPRLPGSGPQTALVDLDALQLSGGVVPAPSTIQVWFGHESPRELAAVRAALHRSGIQVRDVRRLSDARVGFDRTPATWSLQLAILVGLAGLIIAALVLLVLAATTGRLRSRDLASLRMAGFSERRTSAIATGEQLPVVVLSVVVGTVCGLVGARLALPRVPIFLVEPTVPVVVLAVPWLVVLPVALGAGALLVAVGWLAGRSIDRRAGVERIREAL